MITFILNSIYSVLIVYAILMICYLSNFLYATEPLIFYDYVLHNGHVDNEPPAFEFSIGDASVCKYAFF